MHHLLTSRLAGAAVLLGTLSLGLEAGALEVNLTEQVPSIKVNHHNKIIEVKRDQDTGNLVEATWAKTSRNCPPFCIQPSVPVEGVDLMTELDLFEFMQNKVNQQKGFVVDARLPDWHLRGTIPGSINIPFTVFQREPNHPKLVKALTMLGAKSRKEDGTLARLVDDVFGDEQKSESWDFSEARELVLWCNGPWCGQSPHAIRALVNLGYPREKLHYYRGGMQMWQLLGLTTVIPEPEEMLFPPEDEAE